MKIIYAGFMPLLTRTVITLLLIFTLSSCASASEILPPTLEQRTLWLDPDGARFFYNYMKCTKGGLFGNCRKWEKVTEYYDLENAETRHKLIDTGFVFKVMEPLTP